MTTTVLGQTPGAVDLTVYRGDTLVVPITVQQGGVPLVLPTTGWLAQVRVSPDSAWMLQFTVDASQAAVGELVLSLTAAQTAAATDGFWDLQNTNGGVVWTYLAGRFTVSKDVSHV